MNVTAKQLKIIALMLVITIASTWLLYEVNQESSFREASAYNSPDYYMEDFKTLAMDEAGNPRYKLEAIYMAHYSQNDATEVLNPRMQFYRDQQPPLNVTANKGWLTADNEVVLLDGDVKFVETNEQGEHNIQIHTQKARLLINQNYAETDEFARIITRRTTITGTGMQVNFNQGKLTVLSDVHTIIKNE